MKKRTIIVVITMSVIIAVIGIVYFQIIIQKEYDNYISDVLKQSSAYTKDIKKSIKSSKKAEKPIQINALHEGDAYAEIRLDRIQFKNTVYYGDTAELLNKGIGHYIGSHLPGQGNVILLAGHNGTEFSQLRNFEKNDIVTLKTMYGEYRYRVYDMNVREASDFTSAELESDSERLIMYCCYPFDELGTSQRYFVYASYVSGPKVKGILE